MLTRAKKQISNLIPPSIIFATAQLAMVVMIFFNQFNVTNTDFIQGLLCGYSIVGNLFSLIHYSRTRKENK